MTDQLRIVSSQSYIPPLSFTNNSAQAGWSPNEVGGHLGFNPVTCLVEAPFSSGLQRKSSSITERAANFLLVKVACERVLVEVVSVYCRVMSWQPLEASQWTEMVVRDHASNQDLLDSLEKMIELNGDIHQLLQQQEREMLARQKEAQRITFLTQELLVLLRELIKLNQDNDQYPQLREQEVLSQQEEARCTAYLTEKLLPLLRERIELNWDIRQQLQVQKRVISGQEMPPEQNLPFVARRSTLLSKWEGLNQSICTQVQAYTQQDDQKSRMFQQWLFA